MIAPTTAVCDGFSGSSLPLAMPSDARVLSEDTEALLAAVGAINEDQKLGRYELLMPIGRGGMAIVWAARLRGSHSFSKIVAIKTMLPMLSADPRFERMFLAEAEIASRIKHPNVCEILDLGEDRSVLYLVMEWIDGEPLSTLLRLARAQGRTIPYGVAASIAAAAARGLHAAHVPLDVVHRDVSPQNILVDVDGRVKIVDFGVAKAAQRSDQVTDAGYIKGKVAYLAPEQVRTDDVDARADVFALGTVLYEMTTGKHPLRGETDLDTLLRIASPDPPPAVGADYPAALHAIVLRALKKDREERYPSMRELAGDLDAYLAGASERLPDDGVASFVRELVEARREARARELREAIVDADDRTLRRERAARAAATSDRRSLRPPLSRRTIGTIVAVGLAGIGVGALSVRGSPATSPAAVVTAVATPGAASIPVERVPSPPAPSPQVSIPSATATTASARISVARPNRTTSGAGSTAPLPEPPRAAPSTPPPTRFRQPGF